MLIDCPSNNPPDSCCRSAVPREVALVAILALVIALVSGGYFHLVFARGIETDLQPHLKMVSLSIEHHAWPANFLYFWVVALCAGFSPDPTRLQRAAVVVLTAACVLRFLVSIWVGNQLLREQPEWGRRGDLRVAFCVAVFLLQIAHNVIDLYYSPYLGYFPPMVWHNSTTIMLMPWAILLFYFSYRVVTRASASDFWLFALVAVVNVAIKNSLFQVVAVVVPIASLLRHRLSPALVKTGLAMVPAAAFVMLQVYRIYHSGFEGSALDRYHEAIGIGGESKIALELLALWPPHTISTIVCSFLYPLAMLVLYGRSLLRDGLARLSLACMVVAMLQFMCLVETGYRRHHGNFTWQVIVGVYLLFLAMIVFQVRQLLQRPRPKEADVVAAVAFALHVLSGIIYLGIVLATGNFRGD